MGLCSSVRNRYEGALRIKRSPMVLDNDCRPLGSAFALGCACAMDKQVDPGHRNFSNRRARLRDHSRVHCVGRETDEAGTASR